MHEGFFDEDGCKTCIDTIDCKKQQCTCETCQSLITGTVVCCSTCKKWYHDARQKATKKDYPNKPKFRHLFFQESSLPWIRPPILTLVR